MLVAENIDGLLVDLGALEPEHDKGELGLELVEGAEGVLLDQRELRKGQ